MNPIDMKLPKRDKKSENQPVACDEQEQYPYGLQISLEKDQLAKLGIFDLIDVGDNVTITATGTTTSKRSNERKDGKDISLSIQIKAIGVEPEKSLEDVSTEEYMRRRNKLPR